MIDILKLIHAREVTIKLTNQYVDSFDKNDDINSYTLSLCKKNPKLYRETVEDVNKYIYFLIQKEIPDNLLGYGSFVNPRVFNFFDRYLDLGNITYGVKPSERRKGYGTKILELLLEECQKIGIKEIAVSCLDNNEASRKIILANGGEFSKRFKTKTGNIGSKYFIHLASPKIIEGTPYTKQ